MAKLACTCSANKMRCFDPQVKRDWRKENWVVTRRKCNYSAFSGNRYTPSDYSEVFCKQCHSRWRTKAAYVNALPNGQERDMMLLGRVWNALDRSERMMLLRHCNTITHESIKQHESTLSWDKLMPVTQNDLLKVDAEGILGRDLCP